VLSKLLNELNNKFAEMNQFIIFVRLFKNAGVAQG
jgi:hypothetical protein